MNKNINNQNLNSIMNEMGGRLDKKTVLDAAKSGNTDSLINSLSNEDKQKLNDVLNDQKKLEEILKSPKAAALLKMLSGVNKNG